MQLYVVLSCKDHTANNFGIMYSRKRISQNSFSNFIYIFQSHSWYSVRNYKIPKGIMKTRFKPRLPRMSSWKKLHTLDLNFGPLHMYKYFVTGPSKQIPKVPTYQYSLDSFKLYHMRWFKPKKPSHATVPLSSSHFFIFAFFNQAVNHIFNHVYLVKLPLLLNKYLAMADLWVRLS